MSLAHRTATVVRPQSGAPGAMAALRFAQLARPRGEIGGIETVTLPGRPVTCWRRKSVALWMIRSGSSVPASGACTGEGAGAGTAARTTSTECGTDAPAGAAFGVADTFTVLTASRVTVTGCAPLRVACRRA